MVLKCIWNYSAVEGWKSIPMCHCYHLTLQVRLTTAFFVQRVIKSLFFDLWQIKINVIKKKIPTNKPWNEAFYMNLKIQKLVVIQCLDNLSWFSLRGLFEFQTSFFSCTWHTQVNECCRGSWKHAVAWLGKQLLKLTVSPKFFYPLPQLKYSNPVLRDFILSRVNMCWRSGVQGRQRPSTGGSEPPSCLPALLRVLWVKARGAGGTNYWGIPSHPCRMCFISP